VPVELKRGTVVMLKPEAWTLGEFAESPERLLPVT